MKIVAICILVSFFLCGCSGQQQIDRAIDFRQKMTESEGCRFLCEITADYVEKLYSFTLECSFDNAGNMTFSVLKPDSISGITGKIDNTGGKLTFDEQALAFELLAEGYVTPVSSPWLFIKTVRGGFIDSCSQEDGGIRITFHDSFAEDALQMDVWVDTDAIPVRCEMLWHGRRILSLDVSNFSYL